jgi:hypothetical protein
MGRALCDVCFPFVLMLLFSFKPMCFGDIGILLIHIQPLSTQPGRKKEFALSLIHSQLRKKRSRSSVGVGVFKPYFLF